MDEGVWLTLQGAEELCRKILRLSDSILESSILDESGTVLHRLTRDPAHSKYQPTPEALQKYGTWVNLLFSMAKEADQIFGSTEYITIAHSNFKNAAVPLSQNRGFVAMVVDRSADVEHIASLIQSATSKESGESVQTHVEEQSTHKSRVGSSY